MRHKPIVILRAGDVAPAVAEHRGEYPEWIRRAAGDAWAGGWEVHDVRTEAPLPSVRGAAAFVMTGSSSSVTERAPWMLRAEGFLREVAAAQVPFFGICFGHQLLAQALGGEVAKNLRGREIGTVQMTQLLDDPLFDALPPAFTANATHVDSVVRLPSGARTLAESALEPTQAFAIGETLRAVQFHPEIDGDAMRRYVRARAHLITGEGGDAEAVLARTADAPHGEACLRNFLRHFVR